VVASDVTGVGTIRAYIAATKYGSGKAIEAFGEGASGTVSLSNLISDLGVVASDTAGVGTERKRCAAASFGT